MRREPPFLVLKDLASLLHCALLGCYCVEVAKRLSEKAPPSSLALDIWRSFYRAINDPTAHRGNSWHGRRKAHVCGVRNVIGDPTLATGVDGSVAVGPAAAAVKRSLVHAAGRIVDRIAFEADCDDRR